MYDKEEIKKKLAEIAPEFDIDEKEAKKKYEKYKSHDPFPEIASALLNTADIIDYVAETGMIHPFRPEMALLKPASYAIPLQGKCIYFDESGEKQRKIIEKNKENKFTLYKNSIAFVTLEPYFRIPDYIALRFNLKIRNVYKGLLLGTGPLIDPGFEGLLSFPLHNLTTNNYEFELGEDLVFFEFTKLSPNNRWKKEDKNIFKQSGIYVPFPEEKKEKDVEYYVADAAKNKPVRSSIPDVIKNAEKSAKEAEKSAKEAEKSTKEAESTVTKILKYGIIGIIIAFGAIIYGGYQLVRETNDFIREEQARQLRLENEFKIENLKQAEDIKYLKEKISDFEIKPDSLSTK